jgi:RNA polymerase sigma factor (TIGR02999 family)
MDNSIRRDVTRALDAAATGEEGAAARLLPLVYEELRLLAKARMSKTPPGQTLQATALVHEAYLRVVGEHDSRWAGRGHFFFAAARAMRDILVEQARRKSRLKHGGGWKRADVDLDGILIEPPKENLLALDEALSRLEEEDPEKAGIVMLRYFTGLTTEETAAVLNLSVSTIERKWRVIRAWLRRELGEPGEADGKPSDA